MRGRVDAQRQLPGHGQSGQRQQPTGNPHVLQRAPVKMPRGNIAILACSLLTACDEDPRRCEAVHVQAELVLEVGTTSSLAYATDESLPSHYKELQVRCPSGATGDLSISHDGFSCSTAPSAHGSRSTGWLLEPAMRYVLNVNASTAGDYDLVAEVRDDTELAWADDPICTLTPHVRVIETRDAAVAEE